MPAYIGTAQSRMGDKVTQKTDETPVGNLDFLAMEKLRECIARYFPDDRTLGEEDRLDFSGMQRILADQDNYYWTIDGLDGTGNRQIETTFGGMVARRKGNILLYAAIFRPIDEKMYGNGFFEAEREYGAWRWYGEKTHLQLHATPHDSSKRHLVMMEGSSKKFFASPRIGNLGKTVTTRSSVSNCFAATAFASGQANGFLTVENQPWDTWPAILFITEAGGIVTDWDGNPISPAQCGNFIAAGNEEDHAYFVQLLK